MNWWLFSKQNEFDEKYPYWWICLLYVVVGDAANLLI